MKKFFIVAIALAIVAGWWAYNTGSPATSWANQIKAMNSFTEIIIGNPGSILAGMQDSFLTVLAFEVRWHASPAITAWATATSGYTQLATAITPTTRLATELNPWTTPAEIRPVIDRVALVPNQFAHYCYWNDLRRGVTNPILRI
ncbi:hypothetical protein A2108_00395 [Candidatus Wolfebacteria bacterium GWA1_42_9]|uniref:Uncharacterized protein n=1 Tax=Candidatus Wolfebacteria bacterium GWA1_42_9 TaxID=1802553 RepID=A0A1F8DNB8_9BACT|nr:MAG: hypothetical protein A2108_00395 [Candidatus Wolfebacteria bacterium GWA1_42_9]